MGNRPDYTSNYTHTNLTDTGSIYSILQYTERKNLSLVEVAGYTANAFRIIIDRERVNVAGYSAFEWPLHHQEQFANLGFQTRYAGGPTEIPPTPEELEQALELVQWSLDRGIPVLAWDLFVPEFGVIYGYDDDSRMLRCRDITQDGELPYEKLGRGQVHELYVMAVTAFTPVAKTEMLRGALQLAVIHARTQGYKREDSQYRNGLEGYDAWIEALGRGEVDVYGNALHGLYVYDQRLFAAQFLKHIAEEQQSLPDANERLVTAAKQAAIHYDKVADALAEYCLLFPFPKGGDPNASDQAETGIRYLSEARAAEAQGVTYLEEMLAVLEEQLV
ncbi:hypothetical protein [Paenibacillus radicis (ex Gao et al. 2016)]|uniref:Uncharacterized protein n=1 Tax=Paenibacillus radicis (ex Gao et al. 2016) TaxID=1737354 RepID=A0A917M0D3_9BACL|nr:hypothetical protein [Paenibacillus radicis (ex Gao et al. 2016)]GGG68339.1 hypothetical protein GCM10010918_24010 [Paenibacillus radicis (ex Gao et al. 2016)]